MFFKILETILSLEFAYYLQIKGHQSVIFEKNNLAGGELLHIDSQILPANSVAQEIVRIQSIGVQICLDEEITNSRFADLQKEYDEQALQAYKELVEKQAFVEDYFSKEIKISLNYLQLISMKQVKEFINKNKKE
jgi:NADPH-dependent glutamate synthase beta subunit-like oxidoreductase